MGFSLHVVWEIISSKLSPEDEAKADIGVTKLPTVKGKAMSEVKNAFLFIKIGSPIIYFVFVFWSFEYGKNDIKHKKCLQNDIKILFRFQIE